MIYDCLSPRACEGLGLPSNRPYACGAIRPAQRLGRRDTPFCPPCGRTQSFSACEGQPDAFAAVKSLGCLIADGHFPFKQQCLARAAIVRER
jgi:hypothetical protein